ncbi:MAG: hypothetical protein ACLQVX_23010 [Limisphaerales bacterium]
MLLQSYLFSVADLTAANEKDEHDMSEKQNQNDGEPVDPLAQSVIDELRKSDPRWRLGFPPPEEMERFRAEKAERDFQALKGRAEAKDRKWAELKELTREKLRREKAV